MMTKSSKRKLAPAKALEEFRQTPFRFAGRPWLWTQFASGYAEYELADSSAPVLVSTTMGQLFEVECWQPFASVAKRGGGRLIDRRIRARKNDIDKALTYALRLADQMEDA
jgi:hypothetical protein